LINPQLQEKKSHRINYKAIAFKIPLGQKIRVKKPSLHPIKKLGTGPDFSSIDEFAFFCHYVKNSKKMSLKKLTLTHYIFLGFFLGIAAGWIFGEGILPIGGFSAWPSCR